MRAPCRVALLLGLAAASSGCSNVEPWVKPYERQYFADIVMSAERDPVAAAYINHVFEAREGARGATGSHGGADNGIFAALFNGKNSEQMATLEDGVQAVLTGCAVTESIKRGEKIDVQSLL